MEARELRIGNLVGFKNRTDIYATIQEIYGLGGGGVHIIRYDESGKCLDDQPEVLDDITPIPLTEDWLLKFGCQRIESGWLVKYCDFLLYDPLFKDVSGQYISKSTVKGGLMRKGHYVSNLAIQHVHQLQNLYFALTGEELKII